jgi:hypothetical protein
MFMRKYFQCLAIIGALTVCGYSADSLTVSVKQEKVMKTLEGILAKAGISFGGEFRSQFFSSQAGGAAVNSNLRSGEGVENTSVDFDIKARPNTITQGRLIFRMQQDWRNFYSDISNPIFSRWVSIDGSYKGILSYNAGDFKQKFSPLTLYTPDIDILYEPEIFAQQATVAKNEVFLDDNQRMFQGVNLNFGAEVYPVFNSLKVTALATRLRGIETSFQNGNKVIGLIEADTIEKFMAAANADATFLKGISVGGSFLNIFDSKASYSGPGGDVAANIKAQNTKIGAGRAVVDIAALSGASNWKINLAGEFALSSDDSASYDTTGWGASPPSDTLAAKKVKSINGSAIKAELNAGYSVQDFFNASINVGFINNASNYRNELAQTPDFIGRRIMNVENDGMNSLTSVSLPLYSTFDAMYHYAFKFAPSVQNPKGWWTKEPFSKNSYTPMVLKRSELNALQYKYLNSVGLDPSVQLVMPFGPATPNRTGINGNATLGFLNDRLQAKVLFASLKEIDSEAVMPATPTSAAKKLPLTTYSQAGGGIKAELAKFIGWNYPINLSSSVVMSKAANDGIAGDTNFPTGSVNVSLFAENLYFKFWKRLAFLAGMEYINNQTQTLGPDLTLTSNQLFVELGLEYKVAEGSYVTGTVGQIDVKRTGNATKINPIAPTTNFNQKLVGLFLRVMF